MAAHPERVNREHLDNWRLTYCVLLFKVNLINSFLRCFLRRILSLQTPFEGHMKKKSYLLQFRKQTAVSCEQGLRSLRCI